LLSGQFAMVITPPSISPAQPGASGHGPDEGLAARVRSGPGLWLEWLEELDRASLVEELLADGMIARALAEAPHGHAYDRTLNGKMTVICVLVACLLPGQGYDSVLATAFGLPGLHLKPGTQAPAGPAFSKARTLLGEHVMKRLFDLDAARCDAGLGIGSLWKGLETTALDGTTMELARNDVLADAFGVPGDGARPLLRAVAHVRTATRRWIAAAIGGYHDGENTLADDWKPPSGPASSTSPTGDSSPWTGGSGSPPPARTWPGASRTARNRSRSRPSAPWRTGPSWSCCTNRTACAPGAAARPRTPARDASRTPRPGWSPSPSPPAPAAAGSRPPASGS